MLHTLITYHFFEKEQNLSLTIVEGQPTLLHECPWAMLLGHVVGTPCPKSARNPK